MKTDTNTKKRTIPPLFDSRGSKPQQQQQLQGRREYRAGYSQEGAVDGAFEGGAGGVASGLAHVEQDQHREHEENPVHD